MKAELVAVEALPKLELSTLHSSAASTYMCWPVCYVQMYKYLNTVTVGKRKITFDIRKVEREQVGMIVTCVGAADDGRGSGPGARHCEEVGVTVANTVGLRDTSLRPASRRRRRHLTTIFLSMIFY